MWSSKRLSLTHFSVHINPSSLEMSRRTSIPLVTVYSSKTQKFQKFSPRTSLFWTPNLYFNCLLNIVTWRMSQQFLKLQCYFKNLILFLSKPFLILRSMKNSTIQPSCTNYDQRAILDPLSSSIPYLHQVLSLLPSVFLSNLLISIPTQATLAEALILS